MLDGSEFFECRCGSDEHTLRFILDKKEKEISIIVFLNQYRKFWERFWVSIKYFFGYKCKYGHWDCCILEERDIERLRDLCNNFLEDIKTIH